MVKLFIYVGAAGVVSAALLMLRFVALSDISSLGKVAVGVLCVSVGTFAVLAVAVRQARLTSSRRVYRRLALASWCLGAGALIFLAVAARLGLL